MSSMNLEKFYNEMFNDPKFLQSLEKICENNKDDVEKCFYTVLKELVLPYAKEHDYTLDEKQIKSYEIFKLQSMKKLSEEELENISGGGGLLISALGIIGAIITISGTFSGNSTLKDTITFGAGTVTGAAVANGYNSVSNTGNYRYIMNKIGDTVGAHSIGEIIGKATAFLSGSEYVGEPETEESKQKRTGLTATITTEELASSNVELNGGVAALTAGESNGGLGCSTNELLGYIKSKIGNTDSEREAKYKNLDHVVLKGFNSVQLDGISDKPIVCMDSKGKINSVRISSSKDPTINFVYYPETEQMYVAGSGALNRTPTITQDDLDKIKDYAKLPIAIHHIKMWAWKSFVGNRQQLNFETKGKWAPVSKWLGDYEYINDDANEEYKKYTEAFNNVKRIWFSQYVDKYTVDTDGTLIIDFKNSVPSDINLTKKEINSIVNYCNVNGETTNFNNKVRMNFVGVKPEVDNTCGISEITTSRILDKFALHEKDKYKNIDTIFYFGEDKITLNKDNNKVTIFSDEISDKIKSKIKELKPTSIAFKDFTATKMSYSGGGESYDYADIVLNNQEKNKISDNELELINDILGVDRLYSKKYFTCSWEKNDSWTQWGYKKTISSTVEKVSQQTQSTQEKSNSADTQQDVSKDKSDTVKSEKLVDDKVVGDSSHSERT